MKYDTAIFDFDGTVFDTGEGITTNIARTLAEMNYPPLPPETLKKFIGPSLSRKLLKILRNGRPNRH